MNILKLKPNVISLMALVMATLFLASCEKDSPLQTGITEEIDINEVKLVDNRLYFPSKASFENYSEQLKHKDENTIAEMLEKNFYNKNFYSLKPIVNSKTEEKQITRHLDHLKTKSVGLQSRSPENILENLEDLEDVFGEAVFTSLLNQNAEIQIADEIYKYTDVGLFIVDDDKIDDLNTELAKSNISQSILEPTNNNVREQFISNNNPCGGFNQFKGYKYYIKENDCNGTSTNGGGKNNTTPITNSTMKKADDLTKIANSLIECEGRTNIIGNLFGDNKICIDEYESGKRRVRVVYYDIHYILGYKVGVKVKHQERKKILGVPYWTKQKTDEIALGINHTWKSKNIDVQPPCDAINYARLYLSNGNIYETKTIKNIAFIPSKVSTNLSRNNEIDFLLEINAYNATIPLNTGAQVRTFIYNNFYNEAKRIFENKTNKNVKKFGVMLATPSNKYVQEYELTQHCKNCDKLEEVLSSAFLWKAVKELILTIWKLFDEDQDPTANWKKFIDEIKNNKKPNTESLDAYGMAKRNGKWHGKRLVYKSGETTSEQNQAIVTIEPCEPVITQTVELNAPTITPPDPINITVFAKGNCGSEQMTLKVNGKPVKTWNEVLRISKDYSFEYTGSEQIDKIQVAFDNDTDEGCGRNLFVYKIEVDEVEYEVANSASMYDGCGSANWLYCNGYFEFSMNKENENTNNSNSTNTNSNTTNTNSTITKIDVFAKGNCGSERMILKINGKVMKTWTDVSRISKTYGYEYNGSTPIENVQIMFDNDTDEGCGRNLFVYKIEVDDTVYEVENATMYGGCGSTNWLYCNGYFEFII